MPRFMNYNWDVRAADSDLDSAANCEEAQLAVLMDIRLELQKLNHTLGCQNFVAIPGILRKIRANTSKKRRR